MTIASTEKALLSGAPVVGSEWVQHFPERYAGTRVRVTAVKSEDGAVWVESEEVAFPGGAVWLDLPHWVDIYSPAR
jgi:hypothetical protein